MEVPSACTRDSDRTPLIWNASQMRPRFSIGSTHWGGSIWDWGYCSRSMLVRRLPRSPTGMSERGDPLSPEGCTSSRWVQSLEMSWPYALSFLHPWKGVGGTRALAHIYTSIYIYLSLIIYLSLSLLVNFPLVSIWQWIVGSTGIWNIQHKRS